MIDEFLDKNALFAVLRLKRDFGKENNIGFFGTYRSFPEQKNLVAGIDGRVVHRGDAYRQAQRCLEIIESALRELGASPEHVVRTRMYVREPSDWEAVGRAHGEMFAHVRPATTMVFTGFIDPDMLVEIEAEAILEG